MNAKIISVYCRKGGCGKTTSVSSLAGVAASRGEKVLLVDLDTQGHLSSNFLSKIPEETVASTFTKGKMPIVHVNDHLDILPCNESLATVNSLFDSPEDKNILAKELNRVRGRYDMIIIDCSPALDQITISAITACDYLLVPVQTDPKCLQAIRDVAVACYSAGKKTSIFGIFLTMYDPRTRLSQKVEKLMRSTYGETVLTSTIRRCIKVSECVMEHKDVVSYDTSCNATNDYQALYEEIMDKIANALAQ